MDASLGRRLWEASRRLGVGPQAQYWFRLMTHRANLRDDDLVRVLDQVRNILNRSSDLLDGVRQSATDHSVIIWTVKGGLWNDTIEALLAHALRLAGSEVRIIVCDEFLPACEYRAVTRLPGGRFHRGLYQQLCRECFFSSSALFRAFRLPVTHLSTLVDPETVNEVQAKANSLTRQEVLSLEHRGIPLGDTIRSSVVRFFRTIHPPTDSVGDEVLRYYAAAAMMLVHASERVMDESRPDTLLTSHGIYVSWGVATEVAKRRGINVMVWGRGYVKSTLAFGQGEHQIRDLVKEPPENWQGLELTEEQRHRLGEYLSNRWKGGVDRVDLYTTSVDDVAEVIGLLGLDPAKPTLGLFPNIPWDTEIAYRNVVFSNVLDWVVKTVRFFAQRPQWQLVIRDHPMGRLAANRAAHLAADEVSRVFPTLPPNVRVLSTDSDVSSYALAGFIRAAAVHDTQLGLELAWRGLPVIVTGLRPYRERGFTYDPNSEEEYFNLLERLDRLEPLTSEQRELATKYAYHFYFRVQIPFRFTAEQGLVRIQDLNLTSLHDLLPGRDPYLDLIVRAVRGGKPVIIEE